MTHTERTPVTDPTSATLASAAGADHDRAPLRRGVVGLLDAMADGRRLTVDCVAADAVLDATVPNWRLTARGRDRVIGQLGEFYRHPGSIDQLERWPVPGGEIVEVTLAWTEEGVAHHAHQCHRLDLDDEGRITRDTMFCGGRWSADLMAEMQAAQTETDATEDADDVH